MKVSELQSQPPKVLIYGPAGSGKTALLTTLGSDLHLIDLDDNLDVAFGLDDSLKSSRLAVDVKQFLDLDITKGVGFLKAKTYIYGLPKQIKTGQFPYKYIGLDSLTSLAVSAQNYVMGNSGSIGANPQIQHWGLILNEIANVITALRSLPLPVFILAHETTFVSDDISKVQIAIPGQKLPGIITRMFSEIWYVRIKPMSQGKSKLVIQTAPSSSVTCRSGRGLTNDYQFGTITPDGKGKDSVALATIFAKIYKEKEQEQKQEQNQEQKQKQKQV